MTKTETVPLQNKPKILKQIFLFVLPLVATSILQLLFNTADSIVVGRWGGDTAEAKEISLAAVGSCGALINLIINLFMGLSVGAGVLVARGIGAQDDRAVDDTVHTSVTVATILGIGVAALGFFMSETFLSWMGTDAAILKEATRYMKAYFLGIPAAMVYNYCAAMLRATGDTVHPLLFLSGGGVLNVGLNLFAVLVLRLGAMGVGLATAASNWLACILILLFMMRKSDHCHLDIRRLTLRWDVFRRVLMIGIPVGIQGMLFSISNVMIQSAVNSLDSTTLVAGNTAAGNIEGYIYVVQNSFAQAALTYVSQYMGAKRPDLAHRTAMICAATVVVATALFSGVVLLLGRPLLGLFSPDSAEAVEIGMSRLYVTATFYFLCGLMDSGCNSLRGLGKSVEPMAVSLIGVCVVRVLWIYTVFAASPSLVSLFVSYPVTWGVTALVQYVLYAVRIRKVKRMFAETGQVVF